MAPPDPVVVAGQFDDLEDDDVSPILKKIELVPCRLLEEKKNETTKIDSETDSQYDESIDEEDDDDDDDMEEIRSKLKSMKAEGSGEMTSSKCRGTGGSGGVSDGGKNLKFLNKIFVGEYQPGSASSSFTSKVANELNASSKADKIKTKDKSHRATTEQVIGK